MTIQNINNGETGFVVRTKLNANFAEQTLLLSNAQTAVAVHVADTANPHATTKAQVGLGNVDNTADANKPVSTPQATALGLKADTTALTAHTGNTSNPHSTTKAQVGLGNVDNTSDIDKPVSTAQATAISLRASLGANLFTGNQNILKAWPAVILERPDATTGALFATAVAGAFRWQWGEDTSGNWFLQRYIGGVYAGQPVSVAASNGLATFELLANATKISKGVGSEGGELILEKPGSGSTLAGDVSVDIVADRVRFFVNGGNGFEQDFTAMAPSVIHKMRTTADGQPWSILSFINGAYHTDILNGVYTPSLETPINSAFNSGEDIRLPKSGRVKITDRKDFIREGQHLSGASCGPAGFRLYCDADFNLAAPHVLGGVPYSHVENVFIEFDQPVGATNKAALRQYPWAMSARAAQRSHWKNIGWGGAWNGFDGRGIDATNHPGGSFIHRVQDGALNISGQFQDLFDFVDIDAWHGWEFGYSDLTNVRLINYTEPKYLIFGGNIEALQVGRVHLWMMTLNNQGTSIFKRSFGSVKLDGWASKFEWQNGEGVIGNLDILCDKNTDHNLIEVQGGDCTVGAINIRDTNAHNGEMIRCTAGRFRANGGKIKSTGNGWHSQAAGGIIHLDGVYSETGGNTVRTLPFHKQLGSTGRLILNGCYTDAIGTGSGEFAVTESATGGSMITSCDYGNYRHNGVTSMGNLFRDNINVAKIGEFSNIETGEFQHTQTIASLTTGDVIELYLGGIYSGAIVYISTEGILQGTGGASCESTIAITRQGGTALGAPTVTAGPSNGVGSMSHSAVVSGNNVIIRVNYTASGANSVLKHFIKINGANVLVKKL